MDGALRNGGEGAMARGHYSLFSSSRGENGTDDNDDARDPRRPNLNSRFRGPTLGVHLRRRQGVTHKGGRQ